MRQNNRIIGSDFIDFPSCWMALFGKIEFIVIGAGNPLSRGCVIRFLFDYCLNIVNGLNFRRTEVNTGKFPDERKNMAMSVIGTNFQSFTPAINKLRAWSGKVSELLFRTDKKNFVAFDRNKFRRGFFGSTVMTLAFLKIKSAVGISFKNPFDQLPNKTNYYPLTTTTM